MEWEHRVCKLDVHFANAPRRPWLLTLPLSLSIYKNPLLFCPLNSTFLHLLLAFGHSTTPPSPPRHPSSLLFPSSYFLALSLMSTSLSVQPMVRESRSICNCVLAILRSLFILLRFYLYHRRALLKVIDYVSSYDCPQNARKSNCSTYSDVFGLPRTQ